MVEKTLRIQNGCCHLCLSITGVRFQELGVFVTSAFALGVEDETVVRPVSANSYNNIFTNQQQHDKRGKLVKTFHQVHLPITELGSAPKAQIHLWLPGMSNLVNDHCDEKYLGRKLTDNLMNI